MCEACGCGHYEQDTIRIGVPGETRGDDREHSHRASSEGHAPHGHIHEEAKTRTLEIHRSVFEKNDRLAERNRGFFLAKGLLVLNMLSSPGSGKTTL
ncbi:MAG: hydrogenase accessory protein HypB, partial [Verrucomicrobia bacterium]|nr:hydrogenase accessory protein HypB [Verrucomicrobiota bacterium]